ncbi:MAG: hypothetical protein WC334_07260 [Kiritimatiellales bacterium]|jgi:predicted naringenin-chalcone synthase
MKAVYIRSIETGVPLHAYSQGFVRDKMLSWTDKDTERRLIRRVCASSGIETRHSVLSDFLADKPENLFMIGNGGKPVEPGMRERNERYAIESGKLAGDVAGHVITKSGFSAGGCYRQRQRAGRRSARTASGRVFLRHYPGRPERYGAADREHRF